MRSEKTRFVSGSKDVPLNEAYRFSSFVDDPEELLTWRRWFSGRGSRRWAVAQVGTHFALYLNEEQVKWIK